MYAATQIVFAGSMELDEAAALGQVKHHLHGLFPQVSVQEIDRLLTAAHRAYDGRPLRLFVPILVEREVAETLRTRTQSASPPPTRRDMADAHSHAGSRRP